MILVRNLRLGIDEPVDKLKRLAAKEIGVPERDILSLKITKKSLDARKKNDIHWLYAVAVKLKGEERALKKSRSKNACPYEKYSYEIPKLSCERRPVIVGFGPAGMFAALVLSKAGLRPIVIERGRDAEARAQKVEHFRSGGELDPECNVQFGEGGAGTFSDGKLNTGIKDKRIIWMLEQFVEHGAPEHILYDAKPHIGTDILINVVQNIRKTVIANGGEVRFSNKLTGLIVDRNRLTGIEVSSPDGAYTLECDSVILAIGHSARDTFEMLDKTGVPMQPKAFSMGARIEHKQADIDLAQYGAEPDGLPAADYSLNVHFDDGESAYTFCMCPGGYVVAAASEEGGVVTNGMSNCARDGENANAALLVTLTPEDFPDKSTLGGVFYQQQLERAAFEAGGRTYHAPAQLVGDFLAHRPSTAFGSVKPTYRPGVTLCELHDVLPARITSVLEQALPALDKRLHGFAGPDAVMTAPETRSSSPVRIVRGENRQSEIAGLYPCGEGAGYAGGIMSAAVDGILTAEAILNA